MQVELLYLSKLNFPIYSSMSAAMDVVFDSFTEILANFPYFENKDKFCEHFFRFSHVCRSICMFPIFCTMR